MKTFEEVINEGHQFLRSIGKNDEVKTVKTFGELEENDWVYVVWSFVPHVISAYRLNKPFADSIIVQTLHKTSGFCFSVEVAGAPAVSLGYKRIDLDATAWSTDEKPKPIDKSNNAIFSNLEDAIAQTQHDVNDISVSVNINNGAHERSVSDFIESYLKKN